MKLDVPHKKISDIERGRTAADDDFLMRLNARLGLSVDWVLTGVGERYISSRHALHFDPSDILDVLHRLRALIESGTLDKIAEQCSEYVASTSARRIPLFEIEGERQIIYEEDGLPGETDETMASPCELGETAGFACRLMDDSMEPAFHKGDLVLFSTATELKSKDFACVHVDDRSTFRQMFFLEDNIVRLVALNHDFPELRVARDMIKGIFRLVCRMQRF